MEFEGKCKCDGKKTGTICIIVSGENLIGLKGKELKYKLEVYPYDEKQKKIAYNKVAYMGFDGKKHLFEVTSSDSEEKYVVDISTGCGCDHGGKKGVATGKMCTHILSVMKKMVR